MTTSSMRAWGSTLAVALLLGAMAAADTYPRQPGIDVENYRFELKLSDESDEIVGRTTVTVRAVADGIETLTLDLVGKSSPDAAEGMEVTGVRWLGSDEEATYRFADDRLEIELPGPSVAGDRSDVRIDYRGQPATGLIIGDTKHGDRSFFSDNWPIKARQWLPTIDHPYDKATSEMVVTAPAHYQVVSNGLLVEETDLGDGRRLTHWRQSVPIPVWLNALGAARFAVQHLGEVRGIPVQTWVYAQDRDAGFYDFAVPTPHALEFYVDRIGPYSYEKLANVQSNSVRGGMESATAIFYGADSVTGERTERWRNVIVHEVAHQWWGNSVTEADWDDVWLSEGFATYFTTLFIEHAYGRDEMVEMLETSRDFIFEFAQENPDYTIVHDNLDDMSQVLTRNVYQKGGWTLHMLREILGDETFWAGIRDYYALYRNGSATTADFQRAMEEASGRDLDTFFEQWLHRGGGLELEATWSWSQGLLTVVVEQVQPNGLAYETPLDLEITHADGTGTIVELELGELSHSFPIELEHEPTALELDPETRVLARWQVERHSAKN
jgi:aminopeptidase N